MVKGDEGRREKDDEAAEHPLLNPKNARSLSHKN
jgi:hypothetical protein